LKNDYSQDTRRSAKRSHTSESKFSKRKLSIDRTDIYWAFEENLSTSLTPISPTGSTLLLKFAPAHSSRLRLEPFTLPTVSDVHEGTRELPANGKLLVSSDTIYWSNTSSGNQDQSVEGGENMNNILDLNSTEESMEVKKAHQFLEKRWSIVNATFNETPEVEWQAQLIDPDDQEISFSDDFIINAKEIIINKNREIGCGHFGSIYKGFYNHAEVALKMVNTAQYLREGDLFFKVSDHPNVCRFFGIHKASSRYYLVMEYFEDGSLLEVLHRVSFTEKEQKLLCQQIAAGVLHLHKLGVIHADIACRNILVRLTSFQHHKVALTDFGLSCKSPATKRLTIIPPRWASSDLMESQLPTFASDIWALGVTFTELLNNGRKPYAELTTQQVNQKQHSLKAGFHPRIKYEWPQCFQDWLEMIFVKVDERITIYDLATNITHSCHEYLEHSM